MRTRFSALVLATVMLTCFSMWQPPTSFAQNAASSEQATQDVVHMRDGRVLKGKIVNETRLLIIFEYTDPLLKSATKLTLAKEDVALIERDVAVTEESAPAESAPAPGSPTDTRPAAPARTTKAETAHTYGLTRTDESNENAAKLYLIPMKGQMGTDVNSEIYKTLIDDIRMHKPDVIVIEMNCQDLDDIVFNEKRGEEQGLIEFDEYRTLVRLFSTELRDFRQVCWVHDSLGISSMVALSWKEVYMVPKARFGGLSVARSTGFDQWQDEDVRGKMTAAFMAMIKSFLETGGHALELADAMVRPHFSLSASWRGRDVLWTLNDKGEYLVDGNNRRTVEFRAKSAEDFGISRGTAETLDDLALLLGYREYRVVDGIAETKCADYVKSWRRAYEDIQVLYQDYQQYLGWATGQDAIKYLGRAISTLEKIRNYMDRYKPVEIRLAQDYGITKGNLTVQIEMHKERLRGMRRGGGGLSGGGGAPTPNNPSRGG